MADHDNDLPADYDLDEDLFNFDEVMPEEQGGDAEQINLDEIFAAFQQDESEAPEPEPEPEDLDEDPFAPTAPPPAPATPRPDRRAAAAGGKPAQESALPVAAEHVPVQPSAQRATGPAARAASDEDQAAPRRQVTRRRRDGRREVTPRAVTFLTKGAVVVLIAMTLLNVSIGLVTFSSATGMRSDLEAASREMADAALEIRDKVGAQTDVVKQQFQPVAPPTLDEHPTFDRAVADIEVGNHVDARRRIYALLAVVDRQPAQLREDLEARAAFLLARSYHVEAAAAEDAR